MKADIPVLCFPVDVNIEQGTNFPDRDRSWKVWCVQSKRRCRFSGSLSPAIGVICKIRVTAGERVPSPHGRV